MKTLRTIVATEAADERRTSRPASGYRRRMASRPVPSVLRESDRGVERRATLPTRKLRGDCKKSVRRADPARAAGDRRGCRRGQGVATRELAAGLAASRDAERPLEN